MTRTEGSGGERLYLDVPFPDKEQVKALGARWGLPAVRGPRTLSEHWATLPIVAVARIPLDVLYHEGNPED